MSATRSEIQELGRQLLSSHRPEALALVSMIGFFYHGVPADKQHVREFHMPTLWACVAAEMDRLGLTREDLMRASQAVSQANETVALLEALDD